MSYKNIFLLFVSIFSLTAFGNFNERVLEEQKIVDPSSAEIERAEALNMEDNPNIKIRLGLRFLTGDGVFSTDNEFDSRDYEQARKYFEEAGNSPVALYYRGIVENKLDRQNTISVKFYFDTALEEGKKHPDFHNSELYFAIRYALGNRLVKNEEHHSLHFKEGLDLLEDISSDEHKNNKYKSQAKTTLGWMYLEGVGVEKNYDRARRHFEQAKFKDPKAEYYLGRMYYYGLGVEKDLAQVRSSFEKALSAIQNQNKVYNSKFYFEMAYILGEILVQNEPATPEDIKQGFKWLQEVVSKAPEHNEHRYKAETLLGRMYLEGRGVEKSYEKALEHFEKVKHNSYLAGYFMGKMYQQGLGVKRDPGMVRHFFQSAMIGMRVDKSVEESKSLIYLEMAYILGKMFVEDSKIPVNFKKGVELLETVALSTDPISIYKYESANLLGVIYGEKFQNYKKALKWFNLALSGAFFKFNPYYNLAVMHANGQAGVLPNGHWNFLKAYHLTHLALDSKGGDKKGRKSARRMLKNLEKYITPDQIIRKPKRNRWQECLNTFRLYFAE